MELNTTDIKSDKKVNFFLSGGGMKCSFQLAFLNDYIEKYGIDNIENIYCISFANFVAYFLILDKFTEIYNYFVELTPETMKKSIAFEKTEKVLRCIPFVNRLCDPLFNSIWIMYSILNLGLYDPSIGYELLKKAENPEKSHLLKKLKCLVYNVTDGKMEIISGDNPNIHSYIMASCAHWGLYPPVKIGEKTFIDGGIDDIQIFINVLNEESRKDSLNIVLATDDIYQLDTNMLSIGKNMIEYLINVSSHLIDKNVSFRLEKFNHTKNIFIVAYRPPIKRPHDISKENTLFMIEDGHQLFNKFIVCHEKGINKVLLNDNDEQ